LNLPLGSRIYIRILRLSILCETRSEPKLLAFDWDILNTSLNQWKELKMPKVTNTLAAILLLSLMTIPSASFADELESESDTTVSTENIENEHKELNERHNEIEEHFENYEGVVIPPVMMNMGQQANPDSYILPEHPMTGQLPLGSKSSNFIGQQIGVIGSEQVKGFDPYKLDPLPVKGLVLTQVTPADEFIDGAKTLVIGLGIAALGLLGLASFTAYRTRRTKSNNL
jgi:hypothetical protein